MERNESMIDGLRRQCPQVTDALIWDAVRRAPRGLFTPDGVDDPYANSPCVAGNIHLSAPSIYVMQLDLLRLERGKTFLDLGCGSGWFTTLAGLLVGESGRAFGCDISDDIVAYSRARIRDARQFLKLKLPPAQIFKENAFFISLQTQRYDRVLCGSQCPSSHLKYLQDLLRVGGILVVPVDGQLMQITRVSAEDFLSTSKCSVRFKEIIVPSHADIAEAHEKQGSLIQEVSGGVSEDTSIMEALLRSCTTSDAATTKRSLINAVLSRAACDEGVPALSLLVSEAAEQSVQLRRQGALPRAEVALYPEPASPSMLDQRFSASDLQRHEERNESMINGLRRRCPEITDELIWDAMRRAPRGLFTPDGVDDPYADCPCVAGSIHLSAPSIYVMQLDLLRLERGKTFLDLGCGSGWFTTLAGLLVGESGRAFGCDISDDIVAYSRARIRDARQLLKLKLPPAQIFKENAFFISPQTQRYDRVLCGSQCPSSHLKYLQDLLRVGGILVVPVDGQLMQITRVSAEDFLSTSKCSVRFKEIIVPSHADIAEAHEKQGSLIQEVSGGVSEDTSVMEALLRSCTTSDAATTKRSLINAVLSRAACDEGVPALSLLVSEAAEQSVQLRRQSSSAPEELPTSLPPEPESAVARPSSPAALAPAEAHLALEIEPTSLRIDWTAPPIGRGAFGRVHRGDLFGTAVAVKVSDQLSSRDVGILEQEVRVLASVRHPHVVQLLGFSRDAARGTAMLVTELMRCSLHDALHGLSEADRALTAPQKLTIALHVARALSFLHNTRGVHRDLKTANILLDDRCHAKVADFGLSRIKQSTVLSQTLPQLGTPMYMAPELFGHGRAVAKGKGPQAKGKCKPRSLTDYQRHDVYAYAIVLWELFAEAVPFADEDFGSPFELAFHVRDGGRPEPTPDSMPEALQELMYQAWDTDPGERPSFTEIVAGLNGMDAGGRSDAAQGPSAAAAVSECAICMEAERDCVFLPCGHVATCYPCGSGPGMGNCPICRASVDLVKKIYF